MTSKYKNAFLKTFIVAILLTWLPSKAIGYLVPYIALLIYALALNNLNFFLKILNIICLFVFFIVLNFIIRHSFLVHSAILSLITYSSIIVILIVPSKSAIDNLQGYKYYYKTVRWMILVQSIVAYIQILLGMSTRNTGLDADTGDVIQGTINFFSFMPDAAMGFGNQMFVINMLMMITFLLPSITLHKKNLLVIVLGFFAITLASVLHLTASWLASLIVIFGLFNPNIFNRYLLLVIFILFISAWIVYYTQPDNFTLIERYLTEYLSGESLKVLATYQGIIEMPIEYPYMHLIGVGPGQFSSKAGLIGTGQYFGEFYNPTTIPLLPQKISSPFQKYGYDLWEYTNKPDIVKWINSTMNRTFYSILSLYTELGAIIFSLIFIQFSKMIFFLRKCYLSKYLSVNNRFIAICTAINSLFIFFICFFENYLESSQAIFVGLLLIKLCYGYLKNQMSSFINTESL